MACLHRPVLLGPVDKGLPNSFFSPFQRAFDPLQASSDSTLGVMLLLVLDVLHNPREILRSEALDEKTPNVRVPSEFDTEVNPMPFASCDPVSFDSTPISDIDLSIKVK